ncbi:hypothetical protein [Arthrobacter psychrolactophilus]|uniref:hypothetical protein n=1 Tax=Arthrobacter psychrolactophilus TaxID=92442 RepID=UPI0011B4E905|nr:hypothetical protein [Arthrobacter psychrolactophilus]
MTYVVTRFEGNMKEDTNDDETPEGLFLPGGDDALERRRANRTQKLIREASFPLLEVSSRRSSPRTKTPSTLRG